jgi:hypothetical protein
MKQSYVLLAVAAVAAVAIWMWQKRDSYVNQTMLFRVTTGQGKRYRCLGGRYPFVFRKRQRNGKCHSRYYDSQNSDYKKPCYRCQTKSEQKAHDKKMAGLDNYFFNNPDFGTGPL